MSEREMLNRAMRGDTDALVALLHEHGGSVRTWLGGRMPQQWRSVLSVDDVMQQTYIDAFLDFRRFSPYGEGSFRAWLTSVAKCNLGDAIRMLEARKRNREVRRVTPRSSDDTLMALHDAIGVCHSTPSRRAARTEAKRDLQWAIEQLTPEYRRVVEMYDIEEKPIEEVANELQRSEGAVYMMRARAHRRLREIMGNASHYLTTT